MTLNQRTPQCHLSAILKLADKRSIKLLVALFIGTLLVSLAAERVDASTVQPHSLSSMELQQQVERLPRTPSNGSGSNSQSDSSSTTNKNSCTTTQATYCGTNPSYQAPTVPRRDRMESQSSANVRPTPPPKWRNRR